MDQPSNLPANHSLQHVNTAREKQNKTRKATLVATVTCVSIYSTRDKCTAFLTRVLITTVNSPTIVRVWLGTFFLYARKQKQARARADRPHSSSITLAAKPSMDPLRLAMNPCFLKGRARPPSASRPKTYILNSGLSSSVSTPNDTCGGVIRWTGDINTPEREVKTERDFHHTNSWISRHTRHLGHRGGWGEDRSLGSRMIGVSCRENLDSAALNTGQFWCLTRPPEKECLENQKKVHSRTSTATFRPFHHLVLRK